MNASDPPSTGDSSASSGLSHTFPVVGIGASAGGIAPLKEFFGSMPADSGMAFVVILHLSQTHESHLADILQKTTSMPVRQVTETLKVEPDSVYVIPPTKHLRMVDGVIAVVEPETPQGRRIPIDLLFSTLGEAYRQLGICIVLSGTGSDGVVGLRTIKAHGGLAIVQDPAEAEFDAMPRNAIATRLADVVLPVAEMPERLLSLKSISEQIVVPDEDDRIAGLPGFELTVVRDILNLLRIGTGHDFSSYKRPTILRRIARRMQVHGVATAGAYLALLRENPDAIGSLLQDLLISVTRFFRDPAAFEFLEREVVPQLFEGRTVPIRSASGSLPAQQGKRSIPWRSCSASLPRDWRTLRRSRCSRAISTAMPFRLRANAPTRRRSPRTFRPSASTGSFAGKAISTM